jgi:hypothetical protein
MKLALYNSVSKLPALWIQHWLQSGYKHQSLDYPRKLQAEQLVAANGKPGTQITTGYTHRFAGLAYARLNFVMTSNKRLQI